MSTAQYADDRLGLSMFAEHAAQAVGDLADRGIYLGGIQNRRHQIIGTARGPLKRSQSLRDGSLAATGTHLTETLHL